MFYSIFVDWYLKMKIRDSTNAKIAGTIIVAVGDIAAIPPAPPVNGNLLLSLS